MKAVRLGGGIAVLCVLLVALGVVFTSGAGVANLYPTSGIRPSVGVLLIVWTPAILKGFLVNVGISAASMILATLLGLMIAISQISTIRAVRGASIAVTNLFRNSPWLVVLFYCMLLLPFQVRIGSEVVPIPDWFKAILGISLCAGANMADIARGAIQSIPTGQWESADSLAFTRQQTLWRIILPQCVKRILPPWMNLYALVMVSTPLCAIVGVNEVMTVAADILAAQSRHDLLLPIYAYLLALFFLYCYPIAKMTKNLERRFAVIG